MLLPIIEYDIFRLNEYKKRNKNVKWNTSVSYSFLQFNEVDYFNYIFFLDKNTDTSIIDQLISNYYDNNIASVKFIYPKGSGNYYKQYLDSNKKNKTILLCKNKRIQECNLTNEKLLYPITTSKDLLTFTKIYLETFKSANKNYAEICSNFKLLHESKSTDFFLIKEKENIVGVCSNYYTDDYVLLTACGILDDYTNKGYQKKAINERLMVAKSKGYSSGFSWAYEDSISANNLFKSDFSIENSYEESISKPLVNLIATKENLSK